MVPDVLFMYMYIRMWKLQLTRSQFTTRPCPGRVLPAHFCLSQQGDAVEVDVVVLGHNQGWCLDQHAKAFVLCLPLVIIISVSCSYIASLHGCRAISPRGHIQVPADFGLSQRSDGDALDLVMCVQGSN
jgi:hypothetical protein